MVGGLASRLNIAPPSLGWQIPSPTRYLKDTRATELEGRVASTRWVGPRTIVGEDFLPRYFVSIAWPWCATCVHNSGLPKQRSYHD
jgi:hypothetical protein